MRHECQWDSSPSKSKFVKVNHYRPKYGLQHGFLAHTEQQALKGLKMTSVKASKQEKQRSNIYKKRETRNTYETHQQTTTTEHQVPIYDRCKQMHQV